ncbi:sigma D regulator [Thalassotalea marina]|uniref:Sigma D regulator n=1 Tax=Thalassotalea marina TaxID=1673741 RepID=A0A919BQ17_9GAMM|nr:sigma D regulator [Thalassotalea marina]GHG04035.1 sigma D regulator [Thalassotalea marina]
MLTQLEQSKKRWGGQNKVIDNWLKERQLLLVAYCELIGMPQKEDHNHSLPSQQDLTRFCQILMDYLSAGHFEIFTNIVAECNEKGPDDKRQADTIFPKLNDSTDLALQFNDKYAEMPVDDLPDNFDIELSALGRALEDRFSLEDQLLDMLVHY